MVRSGLFLAHVRASTIGATSRQNCHPFSVGRWAFCHNGQVTHFAQIRRKLEEALPDDLYAARDGTTDSGMIFLTLLANGLADNPDQAMARMLDQIGTGNVSTGYVSTGDAPVKITCVFTDGDAMYGFRYASAGPAPTLYMSGVLDNGGRAFASEPLDGTGWAGVPEGKIVRLPAPAV